MAFQAGKIAINTSGEDEKATARWRLPYPVELARFISPSQLFWDTAGIPPGADPTTRLAQSALLQWNRSVISNDEAQFAAFLQLATLLSERMVLIGEQAGGWPVLSPPPPMPLDSPRLSALTQGLALSVLIRAFHCTHEETFLTTARRAILPFALDILDGGVYAPIGAEGIFFEETAIYPATHALIGCLCGLLGLFDYLALTDDPRINVYAQRAHVTLHNLAAEFDAGFWTYTDLLGRELTSLAELAFQVALLNALAEMTNCASCTLLAARWQSYQRRTNCRLRAAFGRYRTQVSHGLWQALRTRLFPATSMPDVPRVCVPVTAFPVLGGTRTVLAGVAQVTEANWQLEYLTRPGVPHPGQYIIHYFGSPRLFPSQFPNVWLYCLTGLWKLCSLLRKHPGYHLLLPQDGVFTSAFTALAGKLAGVRVVCIDHGNLTLVRSHAYRLERLQALRARNWPTPRRLSQRLRYACYWPSLRLLAFLAVRYVDHFLIPGIAGDGTEEQCQQLGIRASQITRFASIVNLDHHSVPLGAERARIRAEKNIEADAVVISMVCRLAPEKGLDIALAGLSLSLAEIPPEIHERVRVIIAGEGPLRKHIEEDLRQRGLEQTCLLWGEISPADTSTLLGVSDIFLYTSTRGACFSMSVLEAMASACAVIASTAPVSNAHLLAEGRGIAIPPENSEQTKDALLRLLNDQALCRQMGSLARAYIAQYHSPALFKRVLMRATYWSQLDTYLADGKGNK